MGEGLLAPSLVVGHKCRLFDILMVLPDLEFFQTPKCAKSEYLVHCLKTQHHDRYRPARRAQSQKSRSVVPEFP